MACYVLTGVIWVKCVLVMIFNLTYIDQSGPVVYYLLAKRGERCQFLQRAEGDLKVSQTGDSSWMGDPVLMLYDGGGGRKQIRKCFVQYLQIINTNLTRISRFSAYTLAIFTEYTAWAAFGGLSWK